MRPLDRKRDELAAQVSARLKALDGGHYAEARRILDAITAASSTKYRAVARS